MIRVVPSSFLGAPSMASITNANLLLLLLLLLLTSVHFLAINCDTNPEDASALRSLMGDWENTPPSWRKSDDPCGFPWEGVTCDGSRVTSLKLSTMGLKGELGGDIGSLTELTSLDLSYNRELTGNLSPELGQLTKLNILILAGCGFSGSIPKELGQLSELTFLALNSNKLSGGIPASLGNLTKVYWFDLADNQLTGTIPVSTDSSSQGLDMLLHAKHFHFNKNQLSGSIPPSLFRPEMKLIHVLFDGNKLTGTIPSTIALIYTLEVLRLDRNQLSGEVPSNLNNLTSINELNLADNKLTGPFPNMTGMTALEYLDLSNNQFDESETPVWFGTLTTLTTLVIKSGPLHGPLPEQLFSFPSLQQVILRSNKLNGTLNLGDSISQELRLVDLQHNEISAVTLSSDNTNTNITLMLMDNPICSNELSVTHYCNLQQTMKRAYSTSLADCGAVTCLDDQKLSPESCKCAYPYEGTLYFRGPSFRDLTNATVFHALEMDLWTKLGLTPGSVSLQNLNFNEDDYLQMNLQLFPASPDMYFNRSMVQRIGFELSNQTYKPPKLGFGPYYFLAQPYPFPDMNGKSGFRRGLMLGLSIAGVLLVLVLVGVAVCAVLQKKRAEKAIELSRPFASWAVSGQDSGGAPQLKGARWFTYDELKKSTNNFSSSNEIGAGGYGKVYKGVLIDGQLVAIKRAKQGSMQGGLEFKTEIELLSRVHHKNLVGLVGFCFEQGEQILVYEFMPNGSVRDSLAGKSGIHLDWKKRLRVALGSARGLAYLHELASPPIIHRDVKSTNILLDDNLNAKVADFGLSKLVSDGEKGHVSTQVKGTLGYLDPEYYLTNQLTEKSDVYGFGVVMLELLTAKPPIENGKYVVREVGSAVDKTDQEFYGLGAMLDRAMVQPRGSLTWLRAYVDLALQCTEESSPGRPTMGEVVKFLERMVHDETDISRGSSVTSSSITDFAGSKGEHPYHKDALAAKRDGATSESGDPFEYSGGYSLGSYVEPK